MSGIIGVGPNIRSGVVGAFPTGNVIQVKGSDNYHAQAFDDQMDVIIEASLTNVQPSSHVSIFTSCTINLANPVSEGFETHIFRKATSMGSVGTEISGATRINATGGANASATFSYHDIQADTSANSNMYDQTPFWCIDESPDTGTNYYVLAGSAYNELRPPALIHDGNCTIILMEIAQ